jgi:putative lipase involved disintegration of autophagic bodies
MKTFKVIRSWTGFSEITVQAENEKQAKLLVQEGEYDTDNEVSTGNGLDYGYNNEETIDIQEIEENENE